MRLLNADAEEPQSKLRRWVVTGALCALGLVLCAWYFTRFNREKATVQGFLGTLAAGNTEQAYRIWKPVEGYTYEDFLKDWGPQGEYGPVKSFHIATAQQLQNASGVIVVAEVSPYETFPADSDAEKQRSTKEVRIWVQRSDQSLSFPP